MLRADVIDKLDPEHVQRWRAVYQRSRRQYIEGACSRVDAEQNLRRLGFRDQALKIEVLIWAAEQQRHLSRLAARENDHAR
ncbi:hypothetical protein [Bradyrhizobium valentinum]|uniref:Uncharacterized protein n=1 Tax=Bradyrhizobium valentinum TaxID=1518501 RepID=A0A0R3KVE3_9BRAD|nr:hypothetical protein [Bradyrhizobium valentinum]KRQ99258.1 hypothetical protein CP49_11715 [Bradyrhizobium valentinum]